ncbi:site-specific integrase [soil metagenome]
MASRKTGQLIEREKGVWTVRIYLGEDASGKRLYHNETTKGAKKDAQKRLTKVLREKDSGVYVQSSAMTLNDFLDKWLAESASLKIRERTLNGYESLLNCHVREKLGAKRLSDIQLLEVQKLYNEMNKANYSPKTIRHVHNVLSSALKQAVKWKMLMQNPCDFCDLPRQVRSEMKCFTPDEAKLFLQAAKNEKFYALFYLAIETGMRPEEYLGLKWLDIDFEQKSLSVQRALVERKGGGFIFDELKTSRSRRSIPLSNSLINVLKTHRRIQLEERMKLGASYQNHDVVFASEVGTPMMHRNLLRRHFKPLLVKANLPDIRLYDLRHTTATLLLSAGQNPKVISERLGHASIVLTLDTYSHVLPTMQRDATNEMEAIFLRKTGTK